MAESNKSMRSERSLFGRTPAQAANPFAANEGDVVGRPIYRRFDPMGSFGVPLPLFIRGQSYFIEVELTPEAILPDIDPILTLLTNPAEAPQAEAPATCIFKAEYLEEFMPQRFIFRNAELSKNKSPYNLTPPPDTSLIIELGGVSLHCSGGHHHANFDYLRFPLVRVKQVVSAQADLENAYVDREKRRAVMGLNSGIPDLLKHEINNFNGGTRKKRRRRRKLYSIYKNGRK